MAAERAARGGRHLLDAISLGAVVLSGTVRSWAAHDDAVAAARSAPGVTEVDDRIRVEY